MSDSSYLLGSVVFASTNRRLVRHRPTTADEYSERTQLEALRELLVERCPLHRFHNIVELENGIPATADGPATAEWDNTELRIEETNRRISQLETYLGSAGWDVELLTTPGDSRS